MSSAGPPETAQLQSALGQRSGRICQCGRKRGGTFMNAPHNVHVNVPPLSRRAESLGTENAFVVLAEVNALVRQGKDIVSFCIGQPDFPTPPNVQDAAIAAIRGGKHGYTPSAGIDELRDAAAKDMGSRRGSTSRPRTSSSVRARSPSLRTRSHRSPITAPGTK